MSAPVEGFGLGTTVHVAPSQCSISEVPWASSPELFWSPTTHTSPVETGASAFRKSFPAEGLGVGTIDHVLPFQCSASPRSRPPDWKWYPTLQTSRDEIAAKAWRTLFGP